MRALDPSYLTPTRVDECGNFEVLYDKGRQVRIETPLARFITPPAFEPLPGIDWLWTDRIPRGRVTVIEGPAGAGKTFLTATLAAYVTCGQPWGDGPEGPQLAGEVLYYCPERESTDVVVPRIVHNGADVLRVIFRSDIDMYDLRKGSLGTRMMEFPQDLSMLEHDLKGCTDVRLVVIDPLRDFCATPRLMRKALAVLDNLAARYKVAIVVTIQADVKFTPEGQIRHVPRPWDEAARYVWCVTRDPCTPELRRFEPKRTTFCREPRGVAFRMNEAGKVTWEPLKVRQTRFERCKTWLNDLVGQEGVWSKDVLADAQEFGFSVTMIYRAREELEITSQRSKGFADDGNWWWSRGGRLPDLLPESPSGFEADAMTAKYAELMKHLGIGEEFLAKLSGSIIDGEGKGRRRGKREGRREKGEPQESVASGQRAPIRRELVPAGSSERTPNPTHNQQPVTSETSSPRNEQRISNSEILVETAGKNGGGAPRREGEDGTEGRRMIEDGGWKMDERRGERSEEGGVSDETRELGKKFTAELLAQIAGNQGGGALRRARDRETERPRTDKRDNHE